MAEFKIGKPVVALYDLILKYTDGKIFGMVKKDDEYTLKGMRQGMCKCAPVLLDIGLSSHGSQITTCPTCKAEMKDGGITWFDSADFAPLEEIGDIMLALQVEDLVEA